MAGWIIGILAPAYTLSRVSLSFRTAFDRVFQTQASHVLMHMFLYAVLAHLLASLLFRSESSSRQLAGSVLLTVAIVAVSQEAIQVISGGISFGGDEIFDFFVDLSGGAIGIWLHLRFHRDRGRAIADDGV